MRTYATAAGYRRLQNNGELVMQRMSRELRQATSISSGTYGSSPGTVTFVSTDASGTTHTITFSVVNGAVQISDNGTTGNLTTNEVTVSNLVFRHIITTYGEGIKIELGLTTANGFIVSGNFYDTIVLRGNT